MTYEIGQRVAHIPTGTRGTVCETPVLRVINAGPGCVVIETPMPAGSVWVCWDDTGRPACMTANFIQPAMRTPRKDRQRTREMA